MKIATWNCNMAFRNKAEIILKYKPDILVIPECEHLERLKFPSDQRKPSDSLWFGSNPHKGLGVFSYCDFRLRVHDYYHPAFKLVIPISVTGKRISFTLYAIWANNPADFEGRYITQIWKAVNYYDRLLANERVILMGDFNSNTIWDRPRREGNHSTVVSFLERRGIYSAYHHHFNKEQGKEIHPTLYMYRQKAKGYHIDYCFASKDLITKLKSVEVGKFRSWVRYSDHVPVIVSFDLK